MKLYFSPGACSLSPHIALREAGLDVTLERVDVREKKTASGADFRTINPKGYLPAVELDNGAILTEVSAIVQYIADLAPASKLAPAAGSFERYRLMEWLNYIASELHKSFSPLFNPAATEDMRAHAHTVLATRLSHVAEQLKDREYLLGSQFSVADSYLFTVLGWAGYVKFSLADWPVLQEFSARVAARPAVQEAMRAEGLIQ